MNNKFIISLSMLIALTGAPCWGAAWNEAESDEQMAQRLYNEELDEQMAQRLYTEELAGLTVPIAPQGAETPGDMPEIPHEVIVYHMLKFMPAATLMNMAVARPKFYPFIKTIPQFKLLQQNLNREMQMHNGNKQKVFVLAVKNKYPGVIDVVDYLVPYVDINAQNNNGDTALMTAIINNNPAPAELLLSRGADINAKNMWGHTALMRAVINNNPAVVEPLLAKGANINSQNKLRQTALSIAEQNLTDNPRDLDWQNRARTIMDLLTKGR